LPVRLHLSYLFPKPASVVCASPWRFDGEVYHPEHGNHYGGSVEVIDADRIKLKGCALYVICLEQQWARVITPAPMVAAQ
jgi:hypothetical protein